MSLTVVTNFIYLQRVRAVILQVIKVFFIAFNRIMYSLSNLNHISSCQVLLSSEMNHILARQILRCGCFSNQSLG